MISWYLDDNLMISCWYQDILMISWWYLDDIMMISWYLDCILIILWWYDDILMIAWWYYVDIMISWWYHDDITIAWWDLDDILMISWFWCFRTLCARAQVPCYWVRARARVSCPSVAPLLLVPKRYYPYQNDNSNGRGSHIEDSLPNERWPEDEFRQKTKINNDDLQA